MLGPLLLPRRSTVQPPPDPARPDPPRSRYHGLRDVLLSAALLLAAAFLGSLTSTDLASGSGTPLGSCPWPEGGGAGAGAGGSGTAQLEGFGICWFVLHTCGLAYVLAAPLLLRVSAPCHAALVALLWVDAARCVGRSGPYTPGRAVRPPPLHSTLLPARSCA